MFKTIITKEKINNQRKMCAIVLSILLLIGVIFIDWVDGLSMLFFTLTILFSMKMVYWDLKYVILFEQNKKS